MACTPNDHHLLGLCLRPARSNSRPADPDVSRLARTRYRLTPTLSSGVAPMLRAESGTSLSPPPRPRTGSRSRGPASIGASRPPTDADPDDTTVAELAARVRAGDGAAYEELARRAGPRLSRL